MFRQLLALPAAGGGGGGEEKAARSAAKSAEKREKRLRKRAEKAKRRAEKLARAGKRAQGEVSSSSNKPGRQFDNEHEDYDDAKSTAPRQARSSSSGGSSSGYLSQTNGGGGGGHFQPMADRPAAAPLQVQRAPIDALATAAAAARQNGSTYHFQKRHQPEHQSQRMMDARSLNHAAAAAARRHQRGHPRAPSMVPMVIDDDDDDDEAAGEEDAERVEVASATCDFNEAGDNDDNDEDDLDVRQMLASHRQRRRVAQAGASLPMEAQHSSSFQRARRHPELPVGAAGPRQLIDGLQRRLARGAADTLSRPAYLAGLARGQHANSDGAGEDEEGASDESAARLENEHSFGHFRGQQPPLNNHQPHFYTNAFHTLHALHAPDHHEHQHHQQQQHQRLHPAEAAGSLGSYRQHERQAAIYYQPSLLAAQQQQQHLLLQQSLARKQRGANFVERPSHSATSSFLYHQHHQQQQPASYAAPHFARHQHPFASHKPLPPAPPVAFQQRANAFVKLGRSPAHELKMSVGRQHLAASPELQLQQQLQQQQQQHSASTSSSSPHARRHHQHATSARAGQQLLGGSQLNISKPNLRSASSIGARPLTPTHAGAGGNNQNGPQTMMPPPSAVSASGEQLGVSQAPMGCCGKLAKFLLFVANALFWAAGIALGAWGILALVDDHKYNLSQLLVFEPASRMSLFQLLAWSFITLGCATILVGFCGCSALVKNSRWILGLYIFLILAIFALDLATGLLAIIFQERLVANVRLRLANKLRNDYGVQASFTAAIDYIQTRYECCGLEGHFDYDQSLWRLQRLGGFEATVARTCCHLRNTLDDQAHVNPRPVNESMCQSTDVRFHQSYRYRRGCLDDLERLIRHKIWTFTIGCGAVGAIILLSLVFATCFCRSIKPNGRGARKSPAATGSRVHRQRKQQQQAYLQAGEPAGFKKAKHSSYR